MFGIWHPIRLLLAALFVFGLTISLVGFLGARYPDYQWPWWTGPAILVIFFGSIVGALILFNSSGFRSSVQSKTAEEQIEQLRQKKLIVSESFNARRAFQVEESEDEGLHYFIELDDGHTLYLTGQYLYYFEPIDDDPELNQPRRFPCSAFTIFRHKSAGYVVDILCSGEALPPELVAPAFNKEDWKRGIPEDGTVFTEITYNEIKTQRLRTTEA